ncbi:MAG: 2-oxoglutarate dehydrogenase E1 component, partial [Verrucomicrobiae bacterium]|nr:2-oxoglutarate dehydrogenase E1 component [Verrucomicrobiae bacterium]
MKNPTFATQWNAELIDDNYQSWLNDPESVDAYWRAFFEGFELGATTEAPESADDGASAAQEKAIKQTHVDSLIFAYRSLGHTVAQINPLEHTAPKQPRLDLENFELTQEDLDETFQTGHLLHQRSMKLRDIIALLKEIYCGSVGVEYIHIQETEIRRWIQEKIEPTHNQPKFSKERKISILTKILEAETFENFLHTRYLGQKRFSLEGAETLIAALDGLVQFVPQSGVE